MDMMYKGQKFRVLEPNKELLPMAVYEIEVGEFSDADKAFTLARELAAHGRVCIVQKREWKECTTQEWRYAPKEL